MSGLLDAVNLQVCSFPINLYIKFVVNNRLPVKAVFNDVVDTEEFIYDSVSNIPMDRNKLP